MKEPGEYEARAIEEALRDETIGLYGIGSKKRLDYVETLWPEWVAEKRKQVRFELLGDEPNARVSGAKRTEHGIVGRTMEVNNDK